MSSANYRVVVLTRLGSEIGEIINFSSIKFDKRLNNYGTCTIVVPGTERLLSSLLAAGKFEVKIYRDNTLVWAGLQTHISGEISTGSSEPITITCFDWLEQLNSRFTPAVVSFSSTDAGAIAWSLINTSQTETNGNLGITEGTVDTTVNRDRNYYNQNIMEAIINLSNVLNGFDFEITNEKVFNVYEAKGVDRSSTTSFDYGINIKSANIQIDYTQGVNQAIALGEGFGATQLRQVATDATNRAHYGLRQGISFDADVSVEATLLSKAEAMVAKQKDPIIKVDFVQSPETIPYFGTLQLGDTVKINIERGVWRIANSVRIYGFSVSVDSQNQEQIEYTVSTQV